MLTSCMPYPLWLSLQQDFRLDPGHSFVFIAVICFTKDLYGVKHSIGKQLVELNSTAQAVAQESLRVNGPDLIHQSAPHFDRYQIKIPLEPHDSGDATAMEGAVD
jgi:hypothetical protein